jgi:hypothetical protein
LPTENTENALHLHLQFQFDLQSTFAQTHHQDRQLDESHHHSQANRKSKELSDRFHSKQNLSRLFICIDVTPSKQLCQPDSIWVLKNRSELERFLHVLFDSFLQKECRESCTTRGVVEDLQQNVDDGAKLNHS